MTQLQLRHAEGVATLDLDSHSATMGDLQKLISDVVNIPPEQQQLWSGHPRRLLKIIPKNLLLADLKHADVIFVDRVTRGGSSLQSSSSTPRPTQPTTQAPFAPAPQPAGLQDDGPACVNVHSDVHSGVLVHRVVPDDNSCLFSAVALVLKPDITGAQEMRKIVADWIRDDPETYTDAILGMPRNQYIEIILKPSTWGGAIELGILAEVFRTEIASIDIETGRIIQFSPPSHMECRDRCFLIYSGVHYDAATLSPMIGAGIEFDQTIFPIMPTDDTDPILEAVQELATTLRQRRAFTNIATFDLKCEQCDMGLKGEKEAREHAQATGHVRFGEY